MNENIKVKIHFSDFFGINPLVLEDYGAFNISLINDVPLFVDPFLLFNSMKPEYRQQHDQMIQYLRFLRDKSASGDVTKGMLETWFTFKEVKQNWFGYSVVGNDGGGLDLDFAIKLHQNLNTVFSNFGSEKLTKGSHIEKLAFVSDGVGRDKISDFATNLLKEFILQYTERFALEHLRPEQSKRFPVKKVRFNYDTETWEAGYFTLPFHTIKGKDDFILLTPKDILAKDDIWISKRDISGLFEDIIGSVSNVQMRAQINNYFIKLLPKKVKEKDRRYAVGKTIQEFPELIEYFIRLKEERGDQAVSVSNEQVGEIETIFVHQVRALVDQLAQQTAFYDGGESTYQESLKRVLYLKDVIENKGGHKAFYINGKPLRHEKDVHIFYRLTWFGTRSDVSREVDDGRGPADFKISNGSTDKTIVEFKLASNSKLKQNLEKQAKIYQDASDAKESIKVILFFNEQEEKKLQAILNDLNLIRKENVVIINARNDNKPSASKAK